MMKPTIDELLDQWEDSCESGQPATPEELCRDWPELLHELRWQIAALNAVEKRLGTNHQTTKLDQTIAISTELHIQSLYATGGLGEVYLANDPILQRTVAVKYPKSSITDAEQLARFEREARITGKLNHPGIVPVHAIRAQSNYQPCYVMRFVDGPTLQNHIDQWYVNSERHNRDFFSSIPARQLLQRFVSLCNIVEYAHMQGVVHRDIKPANVILGTFGETLLMDWGLAKELNSAVLEPVQGCSNISPDGDTVVSEAMSTRDGQFMGTPAFASPEQRRGQTELMGVRSDVYSLGATLLNMVTGSLPNRELLSKRHVENRHGGRVSPKLLAICGKAMADNIEQRYQLVSELREDIECYLAGEPISVVPESVVSRISRVIRRRPSWAAAILAGVAITIVASSIGTILLRSKNLQLSQTNSDLEAANAQSLADQQRAKSTTDLLTQAMRSATPEIAQGKVPTMRQLLDETSLRLRTDNNVMPLVAADTHQILADAFLSLGDLERASEHAEMAVGLYNRHSGAASGHALGAMATKAQILSRLDQDQAAIELASNTVNLARTVRDLDAGILASLLDVYGHVCSSSPEPDHDTVVALHREALDLAKGNLGDTDPRTLRLSTNLAVAFMDSGDLAAAEPLLRQTLDSHLAQMGPTHPETLVDNFNLITLMFKKQDFQAAASLAYAQKPVFESVLGRDHQRSIRLNLLIAQIEFGLGNPPRVESEAREALTRTIASFGPAHHHAMEARGIMVAALLAQAKLSEAEQVAEQQYELSCTEFGETHPETIQAITLLFDVCDQKGDVDGMSKWFERLRGTSWEDAAQHALESAKEKLNKL